LNGELDLNQEPEEPFEKLSFIERERVQDILNYIKRKLD